ncbi:Ubiquitin-like-specific protease ESD4 [Platanthera zijinensis]|uniref:Ubiquitin-like-specific protease ESD4 n=1 Tax=Platanthera zijinensis TaxID=2320716 RepID=A0AAP0BZY4_9ASPA
MLAEEKEKLKESNVLSIFTAPRVPQNIPLLYYLVSVYDASKDTFSIGSRELSFTPNDIALIMGLPNNGQNIVLEPKPYAVRTKAILRKEIAEMDSGNCMVSLKSLLLHIVREKMEDVTEDEKKLCTYDLHISSQLQKRKRSKRVLIYPLHVDQKRLKSVESDEPAPHDPAPHDSPLHDSAPNDQKSSSPPPDAPLPDLVKISKDLNRLFARLDEIDDKINKKIDSLTERVERIEELVYRRQTSPSIPCSSTGLDLAVVQIDDSPFKKINIPIEENIIEPYNEEYPGKSLLSEEKRDFIHSRMSSILSKNHIAFTGWNIVAFRDSMEDLLSIGYIGDCHVDAYAKILEIRREKDKSLCRPYLYVSANLWLHNQDPKATIKYSSVKNFVSHITKPNIVASKLILMPVCRGEHWFLLVGIASKKTWILYDSLPNPKRKDMARDSIRVLQKSTSKMTDYNFNKWDLTLAKNVPTQINSYDCGVYVIKYMEHILKPGVTNWNDCEDWAEKMPLFRAEIAYEIFKTFTVDDDV